jgi:solute carrier family 25, member 34/35
MKHFGMQDGPALYLLSSMAGGFVVYLFMHPPDTAMNKFYN